MNTAFPLLIRRVSKDLINLELRPRSEPDRKLIRYGITSDFFPSECLPLIHSLPETGVDQRILLNP